MCFLGVVRPPLSPWLFFVWIAARHTVNLAGGGGGYLGDQPLTEAFMASALMSFSLEAAEEASVKGEAMAPAPEPTCIGGASAKSDEGGQAKVGVVVG